MVKFDDIYKDAAVQYCILRGYDPQAKLFDDGYLNNPEFKETVKKWYESLENKVYITTEEKTIPAQSL